MKKSVHIIFCLGLLLLTLSCEKRYGIEMAGQPIYLSVSLPEEKPETKVPFEGSAPSTSNPLNVSVWASTTPAVFKNEGLDGSEEDGFEVSIHTYGHFQSGSPQLLTQAIYPPPREGESGSYTAAPVYFVAMHPRSADWTTDADGETAKYIFSGCEDVMFAPQVQGAYDTEKQEQEVTVSPTLAFQHLLTRISVKMGIVLEEGENLEDVKNAWGEVTALKIQAYDSKGGGVLEGLNTVSIDLKQGEGFDYDSDVKFSYGGAGSSIGSSMNFYLTGTDTEFSGASVSLSNEMEELAYVMCAPVVAINDSHEYLITVTTKNRGEQKVVLDLMKDGSTKFIGSTRGKHFGVSLKFKKGNAIAIDAGVDDWQNGGFGSGEFDD